MKGWQQLGCVTASSYRGEDWRERAACRETDPEAFFPTAAANTPAGKKQLVSAKAVCARCPVSQLCLEWAMDALPYGIAGGMSEDERADRRGGHQLTTWRYSGSDRVREQCGSEAGAARHRRRKEPVCFACRFAENEKSAERKARRAAEVTS